MSGIAARLITILVLAGLALAVTASSGAAASPARARILGVVPHTPASWLRRRFRTRSRRPSEPPARPRSRSTRNTRARSTSSSRTSPTTAAAPATSTRSPRSTTTAAHGHIQYQSTFGGSYVDHDPLPANGCDDAPPTPRPVLPHGPAAPERDPDGADREGLARRPRPHLLPHDTQRRRVVFESAAGSCSTDTFCAYHSDFINSNNEDVIYANEPYEGSDPSGAAPTLPRASRTTRTPTPRSTPSATSTTRRSPIRSGNRRGSPHDGNENGDLCAFGFGTPLGGTSNGRRLTTR